MKVHVVLGRHGEVEVFRDVEDALKKWAETNGFNSFDDMLAEFSGEIEVSGGNYFLDDGGQIKAVDFK